MKLDSSISRFEIKYFMHKNCEERLKNFIKPYVNIDPYSEKSDNFRYLVKSIYFDTPQLDFYYEKIDGLKIRKKLRIRSYNNVRNKSDGFLEIKRRYDNCVVKERAKLPISKIQDLLDDPFQTVDDDQQVPIQRFLYNYQHLRLRPALLVNYDRDAFMDKENNRSRLTIDYNVRVKVNPFIDDIFSDSLLYPITDQYCILELKFNGFMPKWMRRLVQKIKVRPQSISKYCLGIDTIF